MIVEAEKSHNILSASWRTRKAGGEIQSKSQGWGADGITLTLRLKTWEQGGGQRGSLVLVPESEGPRTKSSNVWGQEKMGVPAQAEKANSPFLYLSVLFTPQLIGGCMTDGESFLLSSAIQMTVFFINTLTTHPDIMFEQVSGHPSTQSSRQIKLTITICMCSNMGRN